MALARLLFPDVALAAAMQWVAACTIFVDTSGLATEASDGGAPPSEAAVDASSDATAHEASVDASSSDVQLPPCPAPPGDETLVAWYPFDEGSGALLRDCSGNGKHGTIKDATWTTDRGGSGALHFNGSSACVDLGDALGGLTAAFTVAAWIFVEDFAAGVDARYILSKTNESGRSWRLVTDEASDFAVALGTSTGEVTLRAGGQASGAWHHVAGVFSAGKRLEVWTDGVLEASATSVPMAFLEDQSAPGRIGCRGNARFFQGKIDDARVYRRDLTADELRALAQ